MRHTVSRLTIVSTIAGAATTCALCLGGATAFAAGSGYGPSTPPTQATAAGFTSIVTAQSVTSSGGSVAGSANGGTCTVSVPAGALANGGEIVISAGAPASINAGSGITVVVDFSLMVLDPNTGAVLSGAFAKPITVTIGDSAITSTDTVVNVTAPGATTPVTGAQVSQGQAVVSVGSDPNLAVVSTPTPGVPVVSSNSLATTGAGPGLTLLALAGVVLILLATGMRLSARTE